MSGISYKTKASYFGGNDPGDPSGMTASGRKNTHPGIAMRLPGKSWTASRKLLNGYALVESPDGKKHIEQVIDLGPNESTGRGLDITVGSIGHYGYSAGNFPTDQGEWKVTYLGKDKNLARRRAQQVGAGHSFDNTGTRTTTKRTTTPAQTVGSPADPQKAAGLQVLAAMITKRRGPNSPLVQALNLEAGQQSAGTEQTAVPALTKLATTKVTGAPRAKQATHRPSNPAQTRKEVYELFYDPQGGWKYGQSIGAIGGHSDHVHVAADKTRVVRIGRQARKMGLHVGENPSYGGVAPVHTTNSFHYKGEAIDVSGSPEKMAAFAKWVRKKYGI